MWRHSLAGKFVTLTVVVVFMIMGVSAYINYQSQKLLIFSNITAQSESLGSFIVSIAPEALLSYDFDALDNYMEEINNGEDVVYAVIFDSDNKAVTTYLNKRNQHISAYINNEQKLELHNLVTKLKSHKEIFHQNFPIFFRNNMLGTFKIGISRQRMEVALRNKLINQIVVSLALTAVLGFGIFAVFRFHIMRPILQLIQGAQRISGGTLDKKVEVNSEDELGRLGSVFNQMMDKLNNSIADKDKALATIKELNLYLEERVIERTTELRNANEQLEKLAMNDSLTGLPNRFCIQGKLSSLFIEARREGSVFAVVMMDLDRFKEINDTLGHDSGDQLLIEVGQRLSTILRPTDFLGRLGGDEFAIILQGADERGAKAVAQKLQTALEPSFYLSNMAFSISASIGIAIFPLHGTTMSGLLKSADVAMYYAKQNKLDYCIYNPNVDRNTPDRLSLMGELRTAIQEDQLELYFQPQIELSTSRIIGVEALVRWNHPDKGFITPDEFIPVAEQSGLIRPLTYWVINAAIRQREIWHHMGIEIIMAINLSVYNLNDADFFHQVEIMLKNSIVPNRFFEFEVTESSIMEDPDQVVNVMEKLNDMNISFAVDDFGTGYSSLSLLKRLPVHKLKIDKSFIMDMSTDTDDAAIVHSIIDMAHILGLVAIAEGVEQGTIMGLLDTLGCDFAQGYYISPPMAEDRITPLLEKGIWVGDLMHDSIAIRQFPQR